MTRILIIGVFLVLPISSSKDFAKTCPLPSIIGGDATINGLAFNYTIDFENRTVLFLSTVDDTSIFADYKEGRTYIIKNKKCQIKSNEYTRFPAVDPRIDNVAHYGVEFEKSGSRLEAGFRYKKDRLSVYFTNEKCVGPFVGDFIQLTDDGNIITKSSDDKKKARYNMKRDHVGDTDNAAIKVIKTLCTAEQKGMFTALSLIIKAANTLKWPILQGH